MLDNAWKLFWPGGCSVSRRTKSSRSASSKPRNKRSQRSKSRSCGRSQRSCRGRQCYQLVEQDLQRTGMARNGISVCSYCRDKRSLVVFVTWYSWDPVFRWSIDTWMAGTCGQGSSERTWKGSSKRTCKRKRKEPSRGKRDRKGITINTQHYGHYDYYGRVIDSGSASM